ncbi:SRPBCC family protein [Sphingopyxis sp.]|uniref:SRPBCC family protein n=1 Tax=Sphingopyxis sp. TaxID=1908224 RepID=UPI002B45F1D1|nr:SRPBCC family protein [Sphingopyxis sp.]HJS10325.1 SRPBCC family protein [Sphingopyxis sp.]
MFRIMVPIAAMLLATGCGKMAELVNQTRIVAAPREQVFAKLFGDGSAFTGLPLVTNGGSTRLYELVAQKGEPGFEKLVPDERPDAYKVKIAVAMEIPREAHLIYSVDDGALSTGLKFTFEELAPDRTRVAFTIDDLTGHGAKGFAVNRSALQKIARDALGKLDDFNEVKEPA